MAFFGIPYASSDVDEGGLVRVCPVCDERCPEWTDGTGELTSNAYGEHYAERHTGVCRRCDANIQQSPRDHAWEDESRACGCGDGEHEPG